MFRLALMVFLFGALPSQAEPMSELWTEPCEKDLAEPIDFGAQYLELFPELTNDEKEELPRRIGILHAYCIDRLITTAETMDREGWTKDARKIFVWELNWVRDLLNGEMAEIYRQSQIYIANGGKQFGRQLGQYLHQWTFESKYPPAVYDYLQEDFKESDLPSPGYRLTDLANEGYMPAMLDAARRFLNGDGVRKNLGIAYYWIKRAEAAHGDVSAIMEKPHERLFEEMTALDIDGLDFMIVRYGDLDWTNIEIPDLKMPPIDPQP